MTKLVWWGISTHLEPLEEEPALAVSHGALLTEWLVEDGEAWIRTDFRPPAVTVAGYWSRKRQSIV